MDKELLLKYKSLKEKDSRLKIAQENIRNRRRNIGKRLKRIEEIILKTEEQKEGIRMKTEEFIQDI